jgi:hypothetical protein
MFVPATKNLAGIYGIRCTAYACLFFSIAGCTTDNKTDYCKNHYVHHANHLDSLAELDIELQADGIMRSKMQLPPSRSSSDGVRTELQLLQDFNKVFRIRTDAKCEPGEARVETAHDSWLLTYTADCGIENRITAVEVEVFDRLPDLEEVLVSVVTAATSKTFVISRQCDNPIFRFE